MVGAASITLAWGSALLLLAAAGTDAAVARATAPDAVAYPAAVAPGAAVGEVLEGSEVVLSNNVLEVRLGWTPDNITALTFVNKLRDQKLSLKGELCSIFVQDDHDESPAVVLDPQYGPGLTPKMSEVAPGSWRVEVPIRFGSQGDWAGVWALELKNGSGYVRASLELDPPSEDAAERPSFLRGVTLFRGPLSEAKVAGSVKGSPILGRNGRGEAGSWGFFLGLEHPQAEHTVNKGIATCSLMLESAMSNAAKRVFSMVVGAVPRNQVRRSFLHYLERERAHPTRPVLHYNSWYDLGTGSTFTAEQATERLKHIQRELSSRNVKLDAFLLDDGWDDPNKGPWQPHEGFSKTRLEKFAETARTLSAGLGVWFSPFGGYYDPRQRRVQAARNVGIEVREETDEQKDASVRPAATPCSAGNPCQAGEGSCKEHSDCKKGLECWFTREGIGPPGVNMTSLSKEQRTTQICFDPGTQSAFLGLGIPAYYEHLKAALVGWLQRGAVLLKLDGIGNPNGEALAEDFESAVTLLKDLRKVSQDVFINLSTGTWPSPFWLLACDTVWRRGHDHYFSGPEGPARERWITYRDAMVYQHVVKASPLFPLNSLMVHGVIFAKDAWDLQHQEGKKSAALGSSAPFRHEVRSAFGSGTMLQELYLTPSLLNSQNWDDLAEAARWVRPRMATLADVHWVGGNPEAGEAYGWGAWQDSSATGEGTSSGGSAVLTLRNPSPNAQDISVGAEVFDLPDHAQSQTLVLSSPYRDQWPRVLTVRPGQKTVVKMAPFDVLVFDSEVAPPPVWMQWLDWVWDNLPKFFWLTLALVAGVSWWRSEGQGGGPSSFSSSSGQPAASAMDAQELRRKRLEALERRAAAAQQQQAPQ